MLRSQKIVKIVKNVDFLYNSDNFYYFLENNINKN